MASRNQDGEDDGVVQLTSSSLLYSTQNDDEVIPSFSVSTTTALRGPVSTWTLHDIQEQVFLLVWVSGIPVHVRYVVHLLEHSAVEASWIASKGTALEVAQQEVLRYVVQRGEKVLAALLQWPVTSCCATLRKAASVLVPLGIAEHAEDETTNSKGNSSGAQGQEEKVTISAIQAVAVEPNLLFSNVTALALYSPGESSSPPRASTTPDASWCSRAYWTAVTQAQQLIQQQFAVSSVVGGLSGTGGNTGGSSAVPSTTPEEVTREQPTLLPASLAVSGVLRNPKRARAGVASGGGASPLTTETETVVIDDEDEEGEDVVDQQKSKAQRTTNVAIDGTAGAGAGLGTAAVPEDDAVIIIDSDDEA